MYTWLCTRPSALLSAWSGSRSGFSVRVEGDGHSAPDTRAARRTSFLVPVCLASQLWPETSRIMKTTSVHQKDSMSQSGVGVDVAGEMPHSRALKLLASGCRV